ncbi:dTDP-4-dehydrorhamnose 3,5-epimerase [Aliiroseovarius sp. PrR006]|uniref:dTDP-4-dehydrorhamnose 3,5-epimerase n=1 Tax=Aliiroseovarius sp. PrR006 TaxID=2706883 RepID=UPI0013D458EF|nr:dTDP-4-dehydrorhamnose 3,5-epimerase [Aliiroseovarius sp. PrR006]
MSVKNAPLPDVKIIMPERYGDDRGFFSESWNKKQLENQGIDVDFVQDNHSLSREIGTIRGLHYQFPPYAQDKLVRCGRGRLLDVVVDVRRGSPTYGRWMMEELSFENGKQLFVPKGFLHGFMTLEPETEIIYKCSDYYAPACDGAVRWDSCGIEWPLKRTIPILSEKDRAAQLFAEFETPFLYEGGQ